MCTLRIRCAISLYASYRSDILKLRLYIGARARYFWLDFWIYLGIRIART